MKPVGKGGPMDGQRWPNGGSTVADWWPDWRQNLGCGYIPWL